MSHQNPPTTNNNEGPKSYRRILIEVLGIIFASISVTMITTLINFMGTLIRLEQQVETHTEIIRELKKKHEQQRSE